MSETELLLARQGAEVRECDNGTTYLEEDGYCAAIDEAGCATIVKCNTKCEDLQVPGHVAGFPVHGIGERAFTRLRNTRRIVLPEGVEDIAPHAFEGLSTLEEVELPATLRSIGDEAFNICSKLREVRIPRGVREIGARITGAPNARFNTPDTAVVLDPENRFLRFDEAGALLQRGAAGWTIVDASRVATPHYTAPQDVAGVGSEAFARNGAVQHVTLNEGCQMVGAFAFRGCLGLAHVELPETLTAIGCGAFSCTPLRELHIPRACVDVDPLAFVTGPVVSAYMGQAYHSQLASISVDEGNPALSCSTGVLCLQAADGTRQAIACTCQADAVDLTAVEEVSPAAFAGTAKIGRLRISMDTSWPNDCPLLPHGACETVEITGAHVPGGCMSFSMPHGNASTRILEKALSKGQVDLLGFATFYDHEVAELADPLERAFKASERLAHPALLSAEKAARLRAFLVGSLQSVCVHFGAHGFTRGFENLLDCGIITAGNIADLVALLTQFGDRVSAAYLLDAKARRFGKASWDYAL